MWFIAIILCTVIWFQPTNQISTPESLSYIAGVVEFSSEQGGGSDIERVQNAFNAYLEIIRSDAAKDVDILVFPESTLNSQRYPFSVPDPDEKISPCGNDDYDPMIQEISCSAIQTKKYIVINITERKITSSETLHYNANVVFDRDGVVVSRYRKWNLYGEAGINVTETADISSFTTDFGVTFGHFICFDIMFDTPALTLIENHVTDILYPTMWFSQLPFLTAIQVQAVWASKHQVNFLAAGASNQDRGSTGSGIYSGKTGPIVTLMSPTPMRTILVAEVVKKEFWNDVQAVYEGVTYDFTPSEMAVMFLKRDNLELYSSKPLLMGANSGTITDSICFGELCCDFNIKFTKKEYSANALSYQYRLMAFDGIKSNRGTLTCAIVACTNSTMASCGYRFGKDDIVEETVIFEVISVHSLFRSNVFSIPNVVTTSIVPTPLDHFSYEESELLDSESGLHRKIGITLLEPHSDLYTFGIFGRDFTKDNTVFN